VQQPCSVFINDVMPSPCEHTAQLCVPHLLQGQLFMFMAKSVGDGHGVVTACLLQVVKNLDSILERNLKVKNVGAGGSAAKRR
jgi:hypothetical protein